MISPMARWHLEYRAPEEDWQTGVGTYAYQEAELAKWWLERIYGLEIRIIIHEEDR